MDYANFLKFIANTNLDSKSIYDSLVKNYGKENIENLYDSYIKDEKIEDEDKFVKIEYYLELQDKKINITNVYYKDALSQYLSSISKIKRLSKDDINKLYIKHNELKEKIKDKNITDKKVYAKLSELGFKNIVYDRNKNFNDGLKYLESINPKNKYVNDLISDIELLSEENRVKKILIEQNLKLVIKIVKMVFIKNVGYDLGSMNVMDIIQEGNIGLSIAIDKYDINKGYTLSTMAFYWIKQSIIRSIENKSEMIRKPVYFNRVIRQTEKQRQELHDKLNRTPTNEEIVDSLKQKFPNEFERLNIKKLEFIEKSKESVLSLDRPIDEDNDSKLVDTIEDKRNIEDSIIEDDNIEDIKRYFKLARLTNKQKLILILRNGLNPSLYMDEIEIKNIFRNKFDDEEINKKYNIILNSTNNFTLEKISILFGLTKEAIRLSEIKSMEKLVSVGNILRKKSSIDISCDVKTLDYYSNLNKNILSNDDINKLIINARNIITILKDGKIKKNIVKRDVVNLYGYTDFKFTTESIKYVIDSLMERKTGKTTIKKLEYYYELQRIIELLINNYLKLSTDVIRDEITRRGLFNYETDDISNLILKINEELRFAIEKFLVLDEENIERFITPYILKILVEEIREDKRKRKTKKL